MKIFIKHIEKILKKDDRLWSRDKDKKLLKNKLVELVSNDDEKLLGLLLKDTKVKKQFFKKIKDSTIFLKDRFLQFITMNEFLPDSFTAFENEIGLSDDKKLITQKDEISLVFPYKDCLLEGGQTKEEVKRDEIFYNTILAPDEIDRIKEPKVLVNWKKFDKDGEHEVKEISKQDNLIIKGNNLLALYSLLPKYRGEIKLIYIDPPYNTGNDEFGYNDRFNHSAWLTFIKNRLEVARDLLADDGIIFVQCDYNEQAYLKVLMDDILLEGNFLSMITLKSKAGGGVGQESFLFDICEYVLIYGKTSKSNQNYKQFITTELSDDVKLIYNKVLSNLGKDKKIKKIEGGNVGDINVFQHTDFNINTLKKDKQTDNNYYLNFNKIFRTTNPQGGLMQRVMPQIPTKGLISIEYIPTKGKSAGQKFRYYFLNGALIVWLKDSAIKDEKKQKIYKLIKNNNFWGENLHQGIANEGGVILKNGKKPERLLKRILDISTKNNDIVLDFFAGAGTTGAVAHKMGRRYILIEQMDYIHELPEQRLKNVINGDQTGISKAVNWKEGGSFIYTELLEWNQKYISQLEKSKTTKKILDIYKKIGKEQFYKYKYEPNKFNLKKFKKLNLREQKKALLDILDMNHLYVNKSSMNDSTFKVDEKDKKLTRMFYEEK